MVLSSGTQKKKKHKKNSKREKGEERKKKKESTTWYKKNLSSNSPSQARGGSESLVTVLFILPLEGFMTSHSHDITVCCHGLCFIIINKELFLGTLAV